MRLIKLFIIFSLMLVSKTGVATTIQTNFFGVELGQTTYSQAETILHNQGYAIYKNAKEIQSDEMYAHGVYKNEFLLSKVIGFRNVLFGGEEWQEVNMFFIDGKFAYIIFYKEGTNKEIGDILDKMISKDPQHYCFSNNGHSWSDSKRYRIFSSFHAQKSTWDNVKGQFIKSPYELIMLEYVDKELREIAFQRYKRSSDEF